MVWLFFTEVIKCQFLWVIDNLDLLLISKLIKLIHQNIFFCMFDKNVYPLGEIDTYSSNTYCSDILLCIRSLRVYRDDILSVGLADGPNWGPTE